MASRIVTRTAIGAAIQTARGLGLKHNLQDFTTLNQAINERAIVGGLPEPLTLGMEVLPIYDYQTDSDNLSSQYIVIGNHGHKNILASNVGGSAGGVTNQPPSASNSPAIPYTIPVEHMATDTGLYNMIPYLGRKVSKGLTISERRDYALRRTIMIEGELWEFYFARKLVRDRLTPLINITHVVNGEETTAEFVPTFNNLKPSHPTEDTSYNASYATVTVPAEMVWTERQIQDIRDACRMLYGSENYAIISEIAICSGVEKPVAQKYPNSGPQIPSNVPANTFFEAVGCQVVMHISTYIPINFSEREYKLEMDFGATEPLYGVKAG